MKKTSMRVWNFSFIKKNKRIITIVLALLLVICFCFLLGGCSGAIKSNKTAFEVIERK